MVAKNTKNWLIRTSTDQLLGPATKEKIIELLDRGMLIDDDEISSGNGYWFWIKEKELLNRYIYGNEVQPFNPVDRLSEPKQSVDFVTDRLPSNENLKYPQEASSNQSLPEENTSSPLPEKDTSPPIPEGNDSPTLPEENTSSTLSEKDASPPIPEGDDSSLSPDKENDPSSPDLSTHSSKEEDYDLNVVNIPSEEDLEYPDIPSHEPESELQSDLTAELDLSTSEDSSKELSTSPSEDSPKELGTSTSKDSSKKENLVPRDESSAELKIFPEVTPSKGDATASPLTTQEDTAPQEGSASSEEKLPPEYSFSEEDTMFQTSILPSAKSEGDNATPEKTSLLEEESDLILPEDSGPFFSFKTILLILVIATIGMLLYLGSFHDIPILSHLKRTIRPVARTIERGIFSRYNTC